MLNHAPRIVATNEDRAPIGDALLARLYRAEPGEIALLVAGLSLESRVGLAAFCYARAHLRAIGREILTHCDDPALMFYGGGALGACLVDARRTHMAAGATSQVTSIKRKVTLATAADMVRRTPAEQDRPDEDETGSEGNDFKSP